MTTHSSTTHAPGPLDGVRVLDLSAYIAGPYGTTLLADQGAEVIKVEPLVGDNLRRYPSTLPEASRAFLGINRRKRAIALNLKQADCQAIIHSLVEQADVLVHNYRPGVPERLSIHYEKLSVVNPRLIYCSLTGYGHKGPLSDKAGYDQVLQAMTGMCDIQGRDSGQPSVLYGSVVDYFTAALVALAITGSLYRRHFTGKGERIDLSLLAGSLAMQSARLIQAEDEAPGIDRDMRSGGVTGIYPTRDGFLYLSANTERFWRSLCELVGLAELADDTRYNSIAKRAERSAELRPKLLSALATRSAQEWEDKFGNHVPCSVIRPIENMFEHEQVQAMDYLYDFSHPTLGNYKGVGHLCHFDRKLGLPPTAAPTLGQHTDDILRTLGYNDETIHRLRHSGHLI